MVFIIEFMINEGIWEVVLLDDGWIVIIKDGKFFVQFEYIIVVIEDGVEILILGE